MFTGLLLTMPGEVQPQFDAMMLGAADNTGTIEPLLTAAGGRIARHLPLDTRDELATIAPRTVLIADLRGSGSRAGTLVDAIEASRAVNDYPVVLMIDLADIDIAASLLGDAVQLLCEPSDAELAGALLAAAAMLPSAHGVVNENEAARLRRLNDEVSRIAEVLARLTKSDAATGGAQDVRAVFDAGPSGIIIEAAEIRRTIRARRLRDRQFGQGLFEDPAWDMLLDLFAAELERAQVSVSSLCVAAAVAPTTALRWIGRLVDAGLFRREPDPFDRRRAFIALTERASHGMRGYVTAVRTAGLPIA